MQPNLVVKNQFGEQSNLALIGGSNQVGCNFIVDSTNGNGLGIRSLKSQGIANVYMHTSATPAAGNPNPAVGYILVEFALPYAGYVNGTSGFVATVSGSAINVTSGLTVGQAYVITSVGTTTAAQWQTLGLPINLTPTVGQCFIAITASAGSGTGVVEVPLAAGSGISHIEVAGDPNQSVATNNATGGSMVLICLGATSSSVTTLAPTAPANNTVIGLAFNLIPVPGPLI